MISKQLLLGLLLMAGGGVVLFAVANNNDEPAPVETSAPEEKKPEVARPVVQPLTADVKTEERKLAQKQKEREARNARMAQEAEELLKEQEKARVLALDKARIEANGGRSEVDVSSDSAARSELIAAPAVQTRPEAIEARKAAEEAAKKKAEEARQAQEAKNAKSEQNPPAQDKSKASTEDKKAKPEPKKSTKAGEHTIEAGDNLARLASRYGVSVTAIAQANKISTTTTLQLGQVLKIPSSSQVAALEKQAAQAKKSEQKNSKPKDEKAKDSKAENTKDNKKSEAKTDAKKDDKKSNAAGATYSVQVALSPDKDKIDDIVKKYRAAGYSVSTSQTSRGLRVLVGSENSYDDANALRGKIANDGRVDSSGAFVKKMTQ
ncbi:hypothetical protein B0181_10835 [Moraxella caviae]|uniref:Cell division protein DedD n=2 Tax=Moraxella caviae TaxID=34060 RepID=A0A1S9ZUY1_9GAMM|nr:LysM peptidoglycan-binding domain-containing protein [Moraxella caviae]OOR87220.1 hypothetical protein B0181_10835 [Moraxella caviae]STZ09930.1 cell division protein DedD [Moraxella caviae]